MFNITYNYPNCEITINSQQKLITIKIDGKTFIYDEENKPSLNMQTNLIITEYSGLVVDQNCEFSWAKAVFLPKGYSNAHYHKELTEDYYIISGKATVIIDNQDQILIPGDYIRVMPNQIHQIINTSEKDDLLLMVRSVPAWTNQDYHLQ